MHLLNLGILAHVDAGKTSLTERLLHTVGVIDEIGSVDDGTTQTDSLALERQRGITIKSAVVSFAVDDVTVNLIDTPGHPDFIAEVERVLGVLDGAVLVVSAVEGVQAQTRVLMRTLRRLRIPTLVFVNKIDRRGARYEGVLRALTDRLTAAVVPMGTAHALGTPDARFAPGLGPTALDVLADHDDDLLTAYVEGGVSRDRARAALVAQTRQALVHPVYFGSAVTGAGVAELITGIRELLPAAGADLDGPLSGTVFKVERGPAGEKVAYARIFSGTLRIRDRIRFGDGGGGSGGSRTGLGGTGAGGGRRGLGRTGAEVGGSCGYSGDVGWDSGRTGAGGSRGGSGGTGAEAGGSRGDSGGVGWGSGGAGAGGGRRGSGGTGAEAGGSRGDSGGAGTDAGSTGTNACGTDTNACGTDTNAGGTRRNARGARAESGGARAESGGTRAEARITAIGVFERGTDVRADAVGAGRIAKLWGLTGVRIGDDLGEPRKREGHFFAPPTLETVVVPGPGTDPRALHLALTRLAEQDPLIALRHDEVRGEISVSLYGEVQKEVVQATLADEFGLDVTFRETTPLCIERPAGTGAAAEFIKKEPNPFLATVGLRVDPAPAGSGVGFRLEVELGAMPYAFFKAVEDTVRETLGQGLHGWQVADCTVTMTHSGYWPRQSHAHQGFDKSMSSTGADFRGVTPLVLVEALRRAGTQVYEPMHRFRVEAPADTLGALLPVLAGLRAVPQTTETRGELCVLEGAVPAAHVHAMEQQLPGLTRGEGELESIFDHYAPVARGTVPERPRTDHNPLNRKEYLLNVRRRVGS